MKAFLCLCTSFVFLSFFSTFSYSNDFDGVELKEVSADYGWYKSDTREPIIYPLVPTNRLDVRINLELLKVFYLNNLVHSVTSENQFKEIGWNYQLGIHLGPFDVYAEHYSRHILDGVGTYMPFPVENVIGVKWYIYKSEK